MNKDSISNYELSNQWTLPPNIQSLWNIPSSTKAVNLNILTPFYDSKHRSSAKGKARWHKKSYTKKSDSLSKRMSGIADPTIKAVEEYPSPYKVSKKSKDFLSQFTISGNENSSYLKSKHLNSIINNLSIESNWSKINKRTTSNAGVIIKGSRIQKLLGAKKQHISKNSTHTNRKKKARSKTKTEKSVVFVMPGQHIANQFIHYWK